MTTSDKSNIKSSSPKSKTPQSEIIEPKASVGIAKMIGDIPDLEIFEGKNDLRHK